ncbi:fibronectin type III domain-containing protein [Cellulomonas palmilytica]|uniref:fibronectin type III domain-containing protein n=1 Tax=Cellulomonas palmilytica TaxID=2608402 RepID=UPI001F42122A|nr:fibronectin type III domain-containing protein [Cellulomonas palmilytica]UJP40846.1 fibronectin type III domain-containing protein [Cellulomonas palmilytica]
MRARRIAATTAMALTAATAWTAAPAAAATPSELTAAVLSPATQALVTSSTLTSPHASATAVRTDTIAGFPSREGGSYAVLATGAASHLGDPENYLTDGTFGSSAAGTRGAATYDVTTLEVRLDVPATANCLLGVTFRFLTDEYPGDYYNDGFIAEVGESTWQVSGSTINAPGNFAFDATGKVISVNSGLFSDPNAATAEASGTAYAFASPRLTAQVPLTPGTQQSLFFSVFDHGDDSVDSAVMIDNLRIGTVADPATDCVRGATTRPAEDLVSAVAPTTVDLSGTADDTYTIPSTEGVVYSVGGAVTPAGTYAGTGTVVVTAAAAPGYALAGASQFTLVFSSAVHVTATEPTWTDTWGTADDTFTIPTTTGVQYSVDGSPVAAGTHPASGTVVVTAAASSSAYELTGASQFTHTFTDVRQVTAPEPTWHDTWGTAEDTVTVPSVTGVQYLFGETVLTPGVTYGTAGTTTITAAATAGYVLTGPASWTYTFTDVRQATAVEPTWYDSYGTDDDTYTIPSVTGVQYSLDGAPLAPGTYAAAGTVTVDVAATAGYVLVGPDRFTHTFTDITRVSATAPSVHDTYGTADDTLTIPSVTGVRYLVDDDERAAGTYPVTGTVVVTAEATAGHELTGTSSWTFTLTDVRLVTADAPTWHDAYGTDDDTYTIPSVTGVQYAVDDEPVAPGTYPAAGSVTVTATATAGHELTGAASWSHTFTDIRLVTADEPTWDDEHGTDDDTFTIPAVTGVQYAVDGSPVAPGTHPATGTVVVTATATAGYELSGASSWTHTFTDVRPATATAPTFADPWETADDTVTIPQVTGVQYAIDGAPVGAGTYPGSGTVTVTATAAAGYVLTGASQWTFTFTDIRLVTPAVPTSVDDYGTADDTFTIPSATGVEYSVDGDVLPAGTYPGAGTVVVTATATAGYALSGATQFTLVFTDITLVTVVAPTWHDVDGTADDTFTLPDVPGVVWTRGGDVLAPGTYPGTGTVTLVATAAPQHELTGTLEHTFTFTDLVHVTPLAPTATDLPGTADDVVTIPAVDGVAYVHGRTPLAPGDHALTGDVTVVARPAQDRYVLVGQTTFTLHLSGQDVPGAPAVTATAGSRSVTVTYDEPAVTGGLPVTGYDYSLDGGTTWTVADTSPLVVTGLVNGTAYDVSVRARNALGAGAASPTQTVTPTAAPLELPDEDGTVGLPHLSPGETAGWVDGERTEPAVGDDEGVRTVTVGGVTLRLVARDADGHRQPLDPAGRLVLRPGGSLLVTGADFRAGESVDSWLFSTPTSLGTTTVEADGTFTTALVIGDDVPLGEHTLQVNGTAANGALVSVAAGVLVALEDAAAAPSPVPTTTPTPALAVTGTSAGRVLTLGVGLLLVGGLVVALTSRRRRV